MWTLRFFSVLEMLNIWKDFAKLTQEQSDERLMSWRFMNEFIDVEKIGVARTPILF